MKRLASVCSRVTLLTSAGRTPASLRHMVLFSLILGGVGGRCLSREALQTRAGGGGSVAAHRERAAHGTHSTPGLPHGHAASSLRRPAFSWCAFGHLPAGGSLGLLNVPLFFFLPQSQQAFVFKRGGAELVCGAVRRERGERGTSPPGRRAVSGPSALPAPRGSFFPVQTQQSERPRPRRSREPRALGLARALTGSRVIRVKVSAGGACIKPGLLHPMDFQFYHLAPSEHGREFRGRGRS